MNQTRDYHHHRTNTWSAPYTFSGKEKDAETGYGYVKKLRFFSSLAFGNEKQVFHYAHCLRRFGARYYDSGLSIWLSVDPMSDKYPSMSPYNYCANNPLVLTDPDGNTAGDYVNKKGEIIGKDGDDDNNMVYFVSDPTSIATISSNQTTPSGSVKIDVTTTYTVLSEVIDVYKRTINNGGMREEATTMIPNFATPFKSKSGNLFAWDVTPSVSINGYHKGLNGVFIHSHPLYLVYKDPDHPSGAPQYCTFKPSIYNNDGDITNFNGFSLNIIVGQMEPPIQGLNLETGQFNKWAFKSNNIGAGFYNSNSNLLFKINMNNLIDLLDKRSSNQGN